MLSAIWFAVIDSMPLGEHLAQVRSNTERLLSDRGIPVVGEDGLERYIKDDDPGANDEAQPESGADAGPSTPRLAEHRYVHWYEEIQGRRTPEDWERLGVQKAPLKHGADLPKLLSYAARLDHLVATVEGLLSRGSLVDDHLDETGRALKDAVILLSEVNVYDMICGARLRASNARNPRQLRIEAIDEQFFRVMRAEGSRASKMPLDDVLAKIPSGTTVEVDGRTFQFKTRYSPRTFEISELPKAGAKKSESRVLGRTTLYECRQRALFRIALELWESSRRSSRRTRNA